MPSHPPLLIASPLRKPPTQGDVPNPDSEAGHSERVHRLALLGFPLHPAGKPSTMRAEHLAQILVPTFFIQGTRDKLAKPSLLKPIAESLGPKASRHFVQDADHSFHILARTGRNDRDVMAEFLDAFVTWVSATSPRKQLRGWTAIIAAMTADRS
jgi:pimeloyl-ACP methyl ester carboxylesterase